MDGGELVAILGNGRPNGVDTVSLLVLAFVASKGLDDNLRGCLIARNNRGFEYCKSEASRIACSIFAVRCHSRSPSHSELVCESVT